MWYSGVIESGSPHQGDERTHEKGRAMPGKEEVKRIKAAAEAELLKLPEVTGVDIGHKVVGGRKTDDLAIIVYVAKKGDVPADQAVPRQIQGVPTDVIERRFVLHAGAAAGGGPSAPS